MALECNRVKKRLAEKIAKKCREPYASVAAIGNPERHVRKASHHGSKQQ